MWRQIGPGFQFLVICEPGAMRLCLGSTGRAECRRSGTRFRPDHWRCRVAFWGERPRKKSMKTEMEEEDDDDEEGPWGVQVEPTLPPALLPTLRSLCDLVILHSLMIDDFDDYKNLLVFGSRKSFEHQPTCLYISISNTFTDPHPTKLTFSVKDLRKDHRKCQKNRGFLIRSKKICVDGISDFWGASEVRDLRVACYQGQLTCFICVCFEQKSIHATYLFIYWMNLERNEAKKICVN